MSYYYMEDYQRRISIPLELEYGNDDHIKIVKNLEKDYIFRQKHSGIIELYNHCKDKIKEHDIDLKLALNREDYHNANIYTVRRRVFKSIIMHIKSTIIIRSK